MIITINEKPIGKGRPRVTRSGHAYTPEKTRDYENAVRIAYFSQIGTTLGFGRDTALNVKITSWLPMPKSWSKAKRAENEFLLHTKKPDCDNIAKAILDALNGLAYEDDSQISSLSVVKRWHAGEGYSIVEITAS